MTPLSEQPPPFQVVTIGPFDDDWAVVDSAGHVVYVGHAIHAARFLARLLTG